jgi:hypothetical protein
MQPTRCSGIAYVSGFTAAAGRGGCWAAGKQRRGGLTCPCVATAFGGVRIWNAGGAEAPSEGGGNAFFS